MSQPNSSMNIKAVMSLNDSDERDYSNLVEQKARMDAAVVVGKPLCNMPLTCRSPKLEVALFMDKYGTSTADEDAASQTTVVSSLSGVEESDLEELTIMTQNQVLSAHTNDVKPEMERSVGENCQGTVQNTEVGGEVTAMHSDLDEIKSQPTVEKIQALGWDRNEFPLSVRIVDEAVQYVGPIGTGSRCLRTRSALPKPTYKVLKYMPARPIKKRVGLFGRKKVVPPPIIYETVFRPFVKSFSLAKGTECNTPRLVSYFEVKLTQGPQDGLARHKDDEPCIAVGVSLPKFDGKASMPGWCESSFGYHGDDGSAFGNCKKDRQYGKPFGAGDVVGCGIDYEKRRIFYTLNGKFLGYSFEVSTRDLMACEWMPTIGLDSHVAVQCSTTGPFIYDLKGLIKTGRAV
eukprot:scaffold5540_cov181-Amphora_coffeaeformis.AAC.6